ISLAGALKQLTILGNRVTAEAGVMLGHMVRRCLAAKLAGLERLAGIPGTVGGAIVMNAGAFDAEISTHLTAVTVVDHSGRERIYSREEMAFGYRSSGLQQQEIIISADFQLPRGRTEQVKRAHRHAARERRARQPLTKRSAGSVFKNPRPDLAAGWLIDQAGLKGTAIGDAQISTKHANFFINQGAATAEDMAQLIKLAARTVRERFDVMLEMEIKTLGFPPNYWEEVGIDG
ncbi:MAG: UDP-N-acetylmuramate dehydrogenase, partial [Candidatus Neomarinimicrobiota bacterium]